MRTRAITRAVSPAISQCELTYLERRPIDYDLAVRQHAAYVDALRSLGVEVIQLPAADDLPDSEFVEDTAIVADEFAIIGRSGVASRRNEASAVATTLMPYRTLHSIVAPGTLEGGDVLLIGHTFYVGRSLRTNDDGILQLRETVRGLGYSVIAVEMRDCLHLKTACSFLGNNTVLLNPAWVSPAAFSEFQTISIGSDANVISIAGTALVSANASETRDALEAARFATLALDTSEFQKAEAGLTCLSLLFAV